jgi:hypothetical protein
MPGLRLDGLERHPGLAQAREARVPALVAGEPRQPGPPAGAREDLVRPRGRQRLASARPLQHDEQAVRDRGPRPFRLEIGGHRREEARRERHDPLVAPLALGDEHATLPGPEVRQVQPKHLAAAQPAQQHRLDHRPVVRNAVINASTSAGLITRGNVRGARMSGTPRVARWLGRRIARPRGTGLRVTPVSPRMIRYSYSPASVARRRLIVRADSPASPSSIRTTVAPRRGARCRAMKVSTSAGVTSAGSRSMIEKNTFRSNAAASTVFPRARPATISR